ncbi:MAG: hypothetical protein QOJ35_2883 [Solirubrobacteraceae bacterium]|nr:hypothetical protein [Solirubrobacteraceae bacterium]
MLQLRTRSIAAGAIVVLSVIGAGAALAAGANKGKGSSAKTTAAAKSTTRADGHGLRGGDDLDAAVAYLGLTPAQVQTDLAAGKTLAQIAAATTGKSTDGLIGALVAHEKAEITAKVTAGTITQAQADAIIPTLTAHFTAFVNGTGFGRGGHGPGGGGHSDEFDAAATYLGLTAADLLTKVQAGQTLAQITAATSGKTVAGLVAALVAAEKTELDANVKAGRITQAQEDAILPTLTATFTAFVNGTGGPHGPGGPGGGHFGFHR